MSRRKPIDWQAVEAEYRAGTLSVRAIAAQFDCTEAAIRDRAKRYDWKRDLSDAVRKEARARLLREELRSANARSDEDIIANSADLRVAVITSHRKDLTQLHGIKRVLMDRLAMTLSGVAADGPCLGEKESPGDLLEKLSRVTARLIPLERQAHNLDEDDEGGSRGAEKKLGGAAQRLLGRLAREEPTGVPEGYDA